jgi:hypothetical protein
MIIYYQIIQKSDDLERQFSLYRVWRIAYLIVKGNLLQLLISNTCYYELWLMPLTKATIVNLIYYTICCLWHQNIRCHLINCV